jgi:hypothetical protein
LYARKRQEYCLYFSISQVLCNKLIINKLQNRLFCNAKEPVLHDKSAYFAMQLIKENEDKSKFVQTY